MKKMLYRFSFVFIILIITVISVSAAVNITKRTGSTNWGGTWTVESTVMWEYETGIYAGYGSWEVKEQPTLPNSAEQGVWFGESHSNYSATHFFLPYSIPKGQDNAIYGPQITLYFSSPGPMSIEY